MKRLYEELFDLALDFETHHDFIEYLKENPIIDVDGYCVDLFKLDERGKAIFDDPNEFLEIFLEAHELD